MTAALKDRRVLVVEDDYYLATDTQYWLEQAGADVVGPTGEEGDACQMAAQAEIDCAVVDINLGDGPRFEVARCLAERRIPFLFATGYDAPALPEEYCDRPRLEKPFNEQQLIEAVRALA